MENDTNKVELEDNNEFESVENEIERSKRKRREIIFEFSLFFVLGVLLGVTVKTEAVKKITIGFNDYQIESNKTRYDIASIRNDLEKAAIEQQKQIEQQTAQ